MDQVTKRRIWILVIACAALFIAVFPAVRRATEAKADGQLTTCWVMCRPGDYVNVRVSARLLRNIINKISIRDEELF